MKSINNLPIKCFSLKLTFLLFLNKCYRNDTYTYGMSNIYISYFFNVNIFL